jgi:hypothetical protein
MAEQVIRRQVDDLERLRGNPGVEADEQLIFGIDGSSYIIDLSTRHAKALREALTEYIAAARPLIDQDAKENLSPAQSKRAELKRLRDWAESQGVHVNTRGRPPRSIVQKYELVNGPLKHQ